ncbi:AAA family ATPase [Streptomyces acidiscabies]|uniref:AAA family ATPase n=1 Tax=Streptomyces acidiscabies TaxID=42234 RepID=A0AAP6EDW7_9ACTN|nr:AAA family ATPase [Streptomyces acidiscabies]MDX2958581.1 AAA family ATPase [Streptomyces acidiscabies]MDX3020913.1 AAA family ATPase [Streptomyces acidiscabies]MDX3790058.1 AAA family ATPase [Streptomyces acidiscabies]GAQ58040.1 hypothetical protein a10_07924 [Streptomyces acidiscabies]GAV44737.1 hypothetical protein Saa2_07715 [Streptomyces acidiscabies]
MVTPQPPVRIGVLGTHSTGKTTLLKRIEMELRGHGVTVARTGRFAKRAAALGLPKMQHHTVASTEWIITQGIADEIAATATGADVVLLDCASYDALAYWRAALEFRGETAHRTDTERLLALAATQAVKYDLLFATVLDPHTATGDDALFRRLVDRHAHALLAEEHIHHQRVTDEDHNRTAAIERALHLSLKEPRT